MTPEVLTVIGVLIAALIGSILGPILVEFMRLKIEPKRKEREEIESRYFNMIKNLKGFYTTSLNKDEKRVFQKHYRLAWLYAPDDVIKAINDFLNAVSRPSSVDGERERKATRNMMYEMRKSFRGKTELKAEDFLILGEL